MQKKFWLNRRVREIRRGFVVWVKGAVLEGKADLGMIHKFANEENTPTKAELNKKAAEEAGTSDPNKVVKKMAGEWADEWGEGLSDDSFSEKLAAQRAVLFLNAKADQDVEAERLQQTAKRYGNHKAIGADGLRAIEVATALALVAARLARNMSMAQRLGTWPFQLLHVLMAIIPKPSGGNRCVAKTAMAYRIWNRMRRQGVRDWEADFARKWDASRKGCSAIKAAFVRSLVVEANSLLGQDVVAFLWDFRKFFDSLDRALLVQQIGEAADPTLDFLQALAVHAAPRFCNLQGRRRRPFSGQVYFSGL